MEKKKNYLRVSQLNQIIMVHTHVDTKKKTGIPVLPLRSNDKVH
jgi:hypothetical protein